MQEINDASALRTSVRQARCAGHTIGLVPTMGFLHAGHAGLIDAARSECDVVIVSAFVNPTQFGPSEDFARYPRDLARDRQLAQKHGVHMLFLPPNEVMYPGGSKSQAIWVDTGDFGRVLEGESRPGHFEGVATVVAKLFHIIEPDRAYFGQKDAQQAAIVERMVADLAFSLQIRVVPTVRELDGLALSSRNVYLSAEERRQAASISHSLRLARRHISDGVRHPRLIEEDMRALIEREAPLARIDYIRVSHLQSLRPVTTDIHDDVLISLAVYFGETRLIDNVIVRFLEDQPVFS